MEVNDSQDVDHVCVHDEENRIGETSQQGAPSFTVHNWKLERRLTDTGDHRIEGLSEGKR